MVPPEMNVWGHLLRVYHGHKHLHSSEGIWPDIAESRGAVLGQVFLSEEAVYTQHPGVLHRLGKDPHVWGAPNVIMTVNEQCIPLHEPLEIHMVARGQGDLQTSKRHSRGKGMGSDWIRLNDQHFPPISVFIHRLKGAICKMKHIYKILCCCKLIVLGCVNFGCS